MECLQFGQRLCVALDQLRHAQQYALLVRRRLSAPAPVHEGRTGRSYRIVRLLQRRGRDACDLLAVCGIDDRLLFAAFSGDPVPGDERRMLSGQQVQRRLGNFVGSAHCEAVIRGLVLGALRPCSRD